MNKTACVLLCSPRPGSVSRRLCLSALEAAGERGITPVVFSAYDLNASGCRACCFCEKHYCCALHDLDDFMRAFEQSSFFVLASPVYNSSLPAPTKAVIDRFQRYYSARFSLGKKPPIEKPKRAMLILTSGSGGQTGFTCIEDMLINQFTVLNTTLEQRIFVPDTDAREPDESFFDAARKAGESFFRQEDLSV